MFVCMHAFFALCIWPVAAQCVLDPVSSQVRDGRVHPYEEGGRVVAHRMLPQAAYILFSFCGVTWFLPPWSPMMLELVDLPGNSGAIS